MTSLQSVTVVIPVSVAAAAGTEVVLLLELDAAGWTVVGTDGRVVGGLLLVQLGELLCHRRVVVGHQPLLNEFGGYRRGLLPDSSLELQNVVVVGSGEQDGGRYSGRWHDGWWWLEVR